MTARSIKSTVAVVIMAALMIMVLPLITAQFSHAAEIHVTFNVTENQDTGQITGVTASWPKVGNASTYIVNLETPEGVPKDQKVTSETSIDYSEAILKENGIGSGTYICKVMPLPGGNVIESNPLTLNMHTLTINMFGYEDNIVLRNIKDRTNIAQIIKAVYVSKLDPSDPEPDQHIITTTASGKEIKKALVGFSVFPYYAYDDMDELEENSAYMFPGGTTDLGNRLVLDGDGEISANWFTVIDNVELNVEQPACGTTTTTPKVSGKWNWSAQTNTPVTSIPEGVRYYQDTEGGEPCAWWVKADDENTPFTGVLTGQDPFSFQTDLMAEYGFVFPYGEPADEMTITVNGAELTDSFCADENYGHVCLSILGGVNVKHTWDEGKITQNPTCTEKGIKTFACTGGDIKTEEVDELGHDWVGGTITKATPDSYGEITGVRCSRGDAQQPTIVIPKPYRYVLTPETFVYSGEECEPQVTVLDSADWPISSENYKVDYDDNVDAGTATATVTFIGDYYEGSKDLSFDIAQAGNPMTVKAKAVTLKAKKVKKKTQTVLASKAFAVSKKKGKVTYKVAKYDKKAKKKTTVSSTGKVTVKKGLKKGTYKVKVNVKDAGNGNYNAVTKPVTLTVRVK